MKCGEVNMPVEAPAARASASRCATVEPLPLVPPTVMTRHAGWSNPNTRATAATRARPMSMVFGCTDSCRASHSASVRTREARQGRGGLGHLQQRVERLLHARATACAEAHERRVMLDAVIHSPLEALADDRAHGAPEELELEGAGDDRQPTQLARHHDERIGLADGLLRLGEAIFVALAVAELERVFGDDARADLLLGRVRIKKALQTLARPDAHAIAPLEDLLRPRGRSIAFADPDQQPGDVAHHVMQKRIRGRLDHHPVAAALDGELLHAPNRRLRLALRRAECAEVMLAAQR